MDYKPMAYLLIGLFLLSCVYAPIIAGSLMLFALIVMTFSSFSPTESNANKEIREFKEKKQAYLQSNRWRSKRLERLAIDGYRCQSCRATGALEVHHKTYRNLEHEPMSDLISLCRKCHQDVHDKYGYDYNGSFPIS